MSARVYRIINTLKPGMMRHRITLQNPNNNIDSGGGHGPGRWSDVYSCWAYITSWDQNESYKGQQFNVVVYQTIIIRYYPGLTEQMNVAYKDRNFRIQTIERYEETNRWHILNCIEYKSPEPPT